MWSEHEQSVGMSDCAGEQQHWRERIEAQRSSGLSVIEFCQREGISKAGFYYWKRRVGMGSREGFLELKVAPPSQVEAEARADAKSVWVPSLAVPGTFPAIGVHLANGRMVVVPAGFDAGHLTRLIAVVEAMA
jgi:hypothetical protein